MAERSIDLVHVTLETDQPLSVAAPENAEIKGVDLPVAKRPTDAAPYVPVSSVVGALREHAAGKLPDEQVLALFGGGHRNHGVGADAPERQLRPSLIRAMGTRTTLNKQNDEITERTQTAIDRFRASAAPRSLRRRESLTPGTVIDIYLSMVAAEQDQVGALRDLLATWAPILGGGRSVGHGRSHIRAARHRRLDLENTDQLAEWLALGGPDDWESSTWEQWPVRPGAHRAEVRYQFRIVDDLLVATSADPKEPAPAYLPASTIKGIFRSRAEFVLRTLGWRACASTATEADNAANQGLLAACRSNPCLICQLFGYAGAGKRSPGRRSLLWFHDGRLRDVRTDVRTHVAIDRIGGGQSHGLLFSQQVVESATLEVGVDLGRASQPYREVAQALLDVVALDIHDGYVGFGRGTARGMGSARLADEVVESMRQTWLATLPKVQALAEATAADDSVGTNAVGTNAVGTNAVGINAVGTKSASAWRMQRGNP